MASLSRPLAYPPQAETEKQLRLHSRSRRETAIVFCLFALALLPRVMALGARSLWLDEAATEGIARLSWRHFWLLLSRHEANMGLYYLLMRGWLRWGHGAAWLRLPSALFGALAVVVGYALLRRGFSRETAILGALLLALNPFAIAYSQDARAYSLAMLLGMLSTLFFMRAIENRRLAPWLAFDLAAIAAVYAHFFAVLVLAAEGVWLLWLRPGRRVWKKAAAHGAVILAGISPLACFVLWRNDGQLFWVPPFAFHILGKILGNFAGALDRSEWQFWPLALAVYGLCLLAVWRPAALSLSIRHVSGFGRIFAKASAPKSKSGRAALGAKKFSAAGNLVGISQPARRRLVMLFVVWLLVPILLCLLISLWQRALVNRFLLVALPPVPLLAAIGLRELRGKFRWAAVAALGALSLSLLPRLYRAPLQDWRAAAACIAHRARPGDRLIVYGGYCALPLEHYLRRWPRSPRLVYPRSANAYRLLTLRHGKLAARYGGIVALWRALAGVRRRRLWLVGLAFFPHFQLNRVTMKCLRHAGWPPGLRFRAGYHFTGVDVALFAPEALTAESDRSFRPKSQAEARGSY